MMIDTTEALYDPRGVPLNGLAASMMTTEQITDMVFSVLADLQATTVEEIMGRELATDGSVAITSHAAVNVLDDAIQHLSVKVSLSSIDEKLWSSIDGLVSVISGITSKLGGTH